MQAAVAAGFPSGNDIHVLKEIQASLKKFDHGSSLRVIEYPASPSELSFFQEAYSDDAPTLLDKQKVLDAQVTLRKSNKNSVQAQRDSAVVSKPAADPAVENQFLQAMKVMGMFMQGRAADIDLNILEPNAGRLWEMSLGPHSHQIHLQSVLVPEARNLESLHCRIKPNQSRCLVHLHNLQKVF